MTGEVSKAAGREDAVGQVVQWVANREADYAKVLPAHIDPAHYVRLSQGLLRKNEDLAAAAVRNPGSYLSTLLDCARLGHEPGTDQYALVPFANKDAPGGIEVVGIEQYQGEIERMYRAGAVEAVVCEVVYEKDGFSYTPGSEPEHFADWFAADRGELKGVYAYARLKGGQVSQVVVMGAHEVAKHREVAKTKKIWDGPFRASMWKKTAIHELEKWVPTSAEYRREQLRAIVEADQVRQQAVYTKAEQVDTSTGEIIEGEGSG